MTTTNTKSQDIVFFCVLLFSFGFVPLNAALRTLSFKRREGCLINNSKIIFKSAARSQLECSVKATSSGHITSSWNAAASLCKMSDVDTTHDGLSTWDCEWLPGWNTFTQKRYPVYNVVGPNGRYTLTFPQAVTLCQEYGTALASPADLLSAKAMGLHLCICGWLSDGSSGFVMQTHQTGCSSWIAEGINPCHWDLVNAYCLLK